MTVLCYLEDTYRFEGEAILERMETGPKGNYVILNQTYFYPKGGGQPCDMGEIICSDGTTIKVEMVLFDGSTGLVHHYISETIDPIWMGSIIRMKIDEERRMMNAKAHTSGHLVDSIIQEMAPELIGKIGNHDQKEGCYVKFQGILSSYSSDKLISMINERITSILQENRPVSRRLVDLSELEGLRLPQGYSLPEGKPCRVVQIQGFPPSPCGGTHVDNLHRIQSITVTKIKVEKKDFMTKVSYQFQ